MAKSRKMILVLESDGTYQAKMLLGVLESTAKDMDFL